MLLLCCFVASRRRNTRCALVTGVQTCALTISVRLDVAVVGKQYPLRTAFDDRGCDAAIRNVSETVRCEHHGYILLAQHLQPFVDACGEQRVVEEHPGFVENEQRRPPG